LEGVVKRPQVDLSDDGSAETLLNEIRFLSEKTHAQSPPAFNDFQKQIVVTQARIEKTIIDLLMQKYSIKVILMSLFYFWFTLEAPIHTNDPKSMDDEDAFLHMIPIIELIKNTVQSLSQPTFTPELKALNEKMQLLKSYLPHPEVLDKEIPENIKQQTSHINTTIHAIISSFIKQDMPLEAITIALFSHWMKLSVFFGVSESAWQKMDYYFSDILKVVRKYLCSIPAYRK
jgi:hypothetical protein